MAAAAKSVGVQTYARVRIFFKGRESLEPAVECKTAEQTTNGKGLLTVLSSEADSVKTLKTEFTDCFPGAVSNEYCYEKVCVPMIEKSLQGFKALLIAYGQTGSGKTFSLIGAKGPGQLGLLPRTLKHFIECDSVLQVRMKGFEAYSTTLTKIPLFDLFDPINVFTFEPFVPPGDDKAKNKAAEYQWVQKKSAAAKALWGNKKGRTGINTLKEGNFKDVQNVQDGFDLVDFAHDNSHFAKTGKNPESSRGHTVYVIILKIKNPQGDDYDPVQTEFVVVDLAGSEGGSTLDALPDGPDKTARFLEGGVINFGLTSLKDMFAEMRKKGKLKASEGNGLRKLLYPFVTSNTMMSIVFTLSPSMSNIMATRATMKFAADACKLKMKPVADTGKKNWQKLYQKLEKQLIEKNNLIKELQAHMNDGAELAASSGGAGGGAASGELYEKFCKMFEAHADRMYGMVQEFGIDSCLSDDVMEAVQKSLQGKKDDYIERLKGVYEGHRNANVSVDDVPAMVEQQISKGIGLQNYYEIVCSQFDKVAEKEIRRDTLLSPAMDNNKRSTGLWMEKAKLLREKTANLANSHEEKMAEVKREMLEEVEEVSEEVSINENAIGDYGDVHIDTEDIDYSAPPMWFQELDDTTQIEVEEKITQKMDDSGKLPPEVTEEIMNELEIDKTQMDDLRTYILIKKGAEGDAEAIRDFQAELGNEDSNTFDFGNMDSNDLNQILELKTYIHQLENEKRVERTMKLWGNMRLRIRDRKLKASQMAVADLNVEKTKLSRHLSERTYALEEKTKEIQRAADELSHMKTAFDVLKRQDHETLLQLSNTLTEEKQTLGEIKTTLMKEHEELKAKNSQLKEEMVTLREERSKLTGELEMAKKQLENHEEMEELNEIQKVLAEVRRESKNSLGETTRVLNEMREELVSKYEERISALQKDNMSKVTEVEKAKNEMLDLNFQIKSRDAKIAELENSSSAMDSVRAEFEKISEDLRQAKKEAEGEVKEKKAEIQDLKQKLQSVESDLQSLESAQKARLEHAEQRSLDAVHSQEDMQTMISDLRAAKQKAISEQGDLKHQLGEATGALNSKIELLNDLQARYEKAMEKNNTLQDEVQEMGTLRNDLYARDADLAKRNQLVAKLENKLEKLEDELSESRRRESNADVMQSSNFDQLKEMIQNSVEKMANNSDIVNQIEEMMKGSDLNQRLENALKDNGELKGEIGKLRGEMMVKDTQLENMKVHEKEMASERPAQKSPGGAENERTIALLQQSIKSLEQQLDSTTERLERERSEKNMCKGRLEEMEQAKLALEAHIKTLQEQLASRGVEPVSGGGASAAELERALQNLEESNRKYIQNLEELSNLKGQLAMKDVLLEDMKRSQNQNQNAGASGLVEQFAQLRNDLLEQKSLEDQNGKIFQLENERMTLQATIDIKDREVQDLRRQLEEKARETPKNIEIQRELSEKDTKIQMMEDKFLRLQRDLDRKDERFNELQEALRDLDTRQDDRFESEQASIIEQELRRQLEDMQAENSRLNRDLENSFHMNANVGQIDELRNKAASALAKQNALESAIAAKNDEIQRANAEIQKLKVEISGLQNQINYERKKSAEIDKQREERIQNLIEYQCQTIRNQLSAMADSAGLQMSPAFLEPLHRDIKRMTTILSSQHTAQNTHHVVNGGGVVHMENVDYGKVIADQISQQRQRVRELEDQAALKNAKINQLQNSMENMKVLHQKEMDEQELAYLLEMRKMREIVRKLRQLSPKVRRLPEILDLDDQTFGPNSRGRSGGSGGGYQRTNNNNLNKHNRYKSADSSRYKTSRSRDRHQ